jgi:hypothetical protein
MYRLSLLPRKVLITTDEVINQAAIDENPDIKQILSAIIIAEERFIKPTICKDLYYKFREAKNVVVNDLNISYLQSEINIGNSSSLVILKPGQIVNAIEFVDNIWLVTLWNEYLWKIIAETVVYISTPTNYSRFSAAGEMENNPKVISNDGQGSASVGLYTMKWKMDKMLMDRIDPLISSMLVWLNDNRSNFPEYNCYDLVDYNNEHNDVVTTRKTGWVNIYRNRRRDRCCD